jgi:mRNA interferase MazF
VRRGELWWASLPEPGGPGPGFRRPVLVIQSAPFNASRINTVIVAVVTSNVRLAHAPGNVLVERYQSRLPRASVLNVSQLLTIDKAFLTARVSLLRPEIMARVEADLKLVLSL